jgi:tocopherol cyclase
VIFRNLRNIWKPEMYHGKSRMKGYFEGWYYRFADKTEHEIGALIPGVSFDRDGEHPHAFVQFLDDSGILSHYYSYDIDRFSYSQDQPEIKIGNSVIEVDLEDDVHRIKGTMKFKGINPWPVTLLSPGAMGWYAFVPMMECYHGVLSFDHLIEGRLEINREAVDFSGGRGYIEKDWGRSFPSYHVWIQTNHFEKPGTSLMVSVANVPWLRRSFDGFLIGLWHDGRLYKFTTYTGARITVFRYHQEELVIHVQTKRHRLEVAVSNRRGAELRTPVVGAMQGRLSESLTAETRVRLYSLVGNVASLLFEGTGRHTGLEIEGEIPTQLSQ